MNIIRYYNQNKKTIWLVIIAIILVIIAIQALNQLVKEENKKNIKENTIVNKQEFENNLHIDVLVSDDDVEEEKELIIDQFIRYCNANKIDEAYDLLTENCKKELFPTIEYFKQNYYNKIFTTTKLYSKELYKSKTYKVKFYDDILSTGSINTSTIEDYYTIEKENNVTKLNISNYINYKEINNTTKNSTLQVNVLGKHVYKEYEEYELEISNLTNKTILLDSKENTKTIYLIGKNNVKYYSLSHELLLEELIFKPKMTKTISIKFTKEYNMNTTINSLTFSDIITDYELYNAKAKKSEYLDRTTMVINL